MKLFSKLQLVVAHQLVIHDHQQGLPCSKRLQTTSSAWREKQGRYPQLKVNHVSINGAVTPWHRHSWKNIFVQSFTCLRVHSMVDAANVTWGSCFASFYLKYLQNSIAWCHLHRFKHVKKKLHWKYVHDPEFFIRELPNRWCTWDMRCRRRNSTF